LAAESRSRSQSQEPPQPLANLNLDSSLHLHVQFTTPKSEHKERGRLSTIIVDRSLCVKDRCLLDRCSTFTQRFYLLSSPHTIHLIISRLSFHDCPQPHIPRQKPPSLQRRSPPCSVLSKYEAFLREAGHPSTVLRPHHNCQ